MNEIEIKEIHLAKEEYLSTIRACGFNKIADRIELIWGSFELDEYFSSLVISNREDRQGFPHEVFSAIIKLYLLHVDLFPGIIKQKSPWGI